MSSQQESIAEKQVTYTLELNGKFLLIKNFPVRVNEETGEEFFSPDTVERLQQIVLDGKHPDRVIETAVYNYIA